MPSFFVVYYDPAKAGYDAINGPNADKTFTAADGAGACGLASMQTDRDGKYVAFSVSGTLKATFETAFAPANSNLVFTADNPGTAGNSIRIRYVVAGNNTALTVSVSTNDITVNLATNGSGVPTSTAAQILAAINASGPASALIDTAHSTGSTGAGVPDTGFGFTNLAYGSSGAAVAVLAERVESATTTPTTF